MNVEIITLLHPHEAVLHQKTASMGTHEFDSKLGQAWAVKKSEILA